MLAWYSQLLGLGTVYHFIWCKKNAIDPIRATQGKNTMS